MHKARKLTVNERHRQISLQNNAPPVVALLLNIFDNSTAGIKGHLYWTEINLSVMKVNLREKMVEAYSESPSATQTVGI